MPSDPSREPPAVVRSVAGERRSAVAAVSWSMRAAAMWSICLLAVAVTGYLSLRVLEKVSLVAFAVILALFFTAVLYPLVNRLTNLGLHRTLSTFAVMFGGIIVFGLVGWFVVAQISSHAAVLGDQIVAVANRVTSWLKTGPLHLKTADIDKYQTQIADTVKKHQGELVSGAVSTARTVFEVLSGLLLALFSTFFLLRDGEQIWQWFLRLLPANAHDRIDAAAHRGWQTLGGYVRGQVTIAFIHAATITVLLLILRVPLAAALGVTVFLGSFIPILGLTLSGALCVGVTLLEHGTGAAIAVAVAIILLVQAEGHLLQPLIMSRAVHIHPLAVVLAVATGTTIYGIIGALIAVPLAAFSNSFIRGLWERPREPEAEAPPTDADPDPHPTT